MTNGRISKSTLSNNWGGQPLLLLAAVIAVMYFARQVLIPLAFAITLSLIWTPPVNWLQKWRFPRTLAVITVVLLTLVAAGGVSWVIFNQLIVVANGLPAYQQNIHNKIEALSSPGAAGSVSRAAESVKKLEKELATPQTADPTLHQNGRNQPPAPVPVQVVDKPTNNLQYFRDIAEQFIGPLGLTGIVLIFSIFLLIEREDVRNRLLRLAGLGQLSVVTEALDDATQRVSRYLLLQFAVNAGFGVVIGIGLFFLGVPYAALWGAVAGALRIVPYVGSLIAGALPLLMSFAVFNSWLIPLAVFGLFATLELVIGNWVEPRLYAAHTGVSSLAILVTTVFWTILWGPAGLILSTPLTVCVAVLGRYVPQVAFLHILLGDEPVLATETLIYQRLLAMDREEAREVVDSFLKEHSILELYDRVLVPALTLAEQDRHKGGLDATREAFIFLSIKEMIVEVSDYTREIADPSLEGKVEEESSPIPPTPVFKGRVLCLPASDEADEITAAMLAQLLEMKGIPSMAFPVGATSHEMFILLQPQPEDVICLSALPPFAFAHARAGARQIRAKFPQTRLFIGVWGFAGDTKKAQGRFDQSNPDRLLVSFTEAVTLFTEGEAPADPTPAPPLDVSVLD